MNSLFQRFARLTENEPGRPLLREGPDGRWLTGCDLLRRAGRLAADLKSRGVGRGSIGLVATGNRPAFIDAVLALWSLDAVVLPIEETHTQGELERIRSAFAPAVEIRTGRRGLRVMETRNTPRMAETGRGPRVMASRNGTDSTDSRLEPRGTVARGNHAATLPGAAIIRMTSGSTGAPRGAVVTAAQAAADGRAIVRKMGIRPEDTNLAAIPLSHSYGFDNVVLPLVMQGTPALLLARPLPALILRALRSRRPVVLAAVPYLLDLLARHPDAASRRRGISPTRQHGLRLCISAAAPLPPATAATFRTRFGVPVHNFYGSSETGGIAFDDETGGPAEAGFSGTPLPGVTITIDRRGLQGLRPGEGRVVVTGPAVASRYFPTSSPDLAKGRLRTSDIGRLDERGRLHLTGRLSSLINVAGRKVNPDDVERALLDLGGVADAAVMGVADPLRGEQVMAWVVARGGMDEPRIRSELARRLSRHEQPRAFRFVRRIPRTPRGKVDRLSLLKSHAAAPRPFEWL